MNLNDLPGRIFLDTSVVNFILEYAEQIHDGADNPPGLGQRKVQDIDALYNIFLTGRRADWQLAVSPFTYYEIAHTADPTKQRELARWFVEPWDHWVGIVEDDDSLPTFVEGERIRASILTGHALDVLPDMNDRILLVDALVYRCDCFCTRDWTTILSNRDKLDQVRTLIATPSELWARIRPYAGLLT